MKPDYNIPPGVDIWAIRNSATPAKAEITRLRWGLVPSWANDPKVGYRMINARSETVAEKPAFRDAFKKRRCLIPADGFYEWRRSDKTPFHIHLRDREPFAMAGLWERWTSLEGDRLDSCTILTTTSNELMKQLHDRMPVILRGSAMHTWLDEDTAEPELQELTIPLPSSDMDAYPVAHLVNSPKNNGPECLEKFEHLQQNELF